ncbi:MAG: anti-sigma F factor [Oscillospiraceae bacterium]|jgi:stage II sporulation protein AB (anti-sigma F factor)|nr:anti-sigma F factor [Oscillospiraceae bacterium]
MKEPLNQMKLELESRSVNEGFARAAIAAFAAQLDPNVEELTDLKTAVSEAVTNCIVHAYPEQRGKIYIWAGVYAQGLVRVRVRDKGCGIANIAQARQPLFSTQGEERAGLGFAVMESFMDRIRVRSTVSKGTTITLEKRVKGRVGAEQK